MSGFLQGTNEAHGISVQDANGVRVGRLEIRSSRGGRDPNVWHYVFDLPAGDDGTSGLARAQAVANALNGIFADTSRDPDFLTPGYGFPNATLWPTGRYGVVWTRVQHNVGSTSFISSPTRDGLFYSGCQLPNCSGTYPTANKTPNQNDVIWVQNADQAYMADVPWDLALWWANEIRAEIDGTRFDGGLVASLLASPNMQNYASTLSYTSKFYLAGELVLYPTVSCFSPAETAHTSDLTIAADNNFGCNTWIRLTLGSRTVVARVNDTSPAGQIEGTSGGVAWALGLSTACTTQTVTLGPP